MFKLNKNFPKLFFQSYSKVEKLISWIIADVTHPLVVDDDSDSSLRLSEANGFERDNTGSTKHLSSWKL